jgi:hypothetical protein
MSQRIWAISHSGGCNGKTNGGGLSLIKSQSLLLSKISRCTDPDCRVVIVEIKIVGNTEIKPGNARLPSFEESEPMRKGALY